MCWPLLGIANALTITALSLELVSYFDSRSHADACATYRSAAQATDNGKCLSLTALWAMYAAVLSAVGLWRLWHLALLALAVFKLIAVGTIAVKPVAVGFIPVLNAHFLTGALVMVLLSVLAWRFRRQAHE